MIHDKTTSQPKRKAVIMADDVSWHDGDVVEYVYGPDRIEELETVCDVFPKRITSENLKKMLPELRETEVIFSCWGMLPVDENQLDLLPNLKAVFYAGGSVNHFAEPFLGRGIIVCSGVEANAIPVAEFCLGQILLSAKGVFRNSRVCKEGPWSQSKVPVGPGIYGETIALVGIGAVCRYLLRLLGPFHLRVIAVSDYLSPEGAAELGIDALVDIEEAFEQALVVSNHFPDKPFNRGIFVESHFASMRQGATFINTGRGAQVDEAALAKVLGERPDLTALLDVQHPEPPEKESPLYRLPNVSLTSHIAGSTNDEVKRMADFVIADLHRWLQNAPLEYQVNPEAAVQRA